MPAYKQMMHNPEINFYEVVDSAEAYFKTIEKDKKGSGYKPYLRWKYDNESKYAPSGNRMLDEYLPWKEYQRIIKEQQSAPKPKLFQSGGWQSLGPDTMGLITGHYAAGLGRVEYVEVNKNNPQQLYMGSRSGGLWRTNNEGGSWIHHTDFLPASGVNAIAASPTYFDSVLVNVRNARNGTSFGIYRSTDGGVTFTQTAFNPTNTGYGGLGSNFKIYVIKYHPRVANLVFIGTSKGIFRSSDNLQTWTQLIPNGDVTDIEFHPINDNVIYIHDVYGPNGNQNRVLKSINQGLSYIPLAALPGNLNKELNIVTNAICSSCIFVSSSNGIWKSYDEGISFETILSSAPAGISLWYATPSDIDTSKYVSGYVDLFNSNDGGRTYTQCSWWSLGNAAHGGGTFENAYNNSSVYVHADCNYQTCVNGVFYVCTDGFLCKSTDNGQSWVKLSLTTGIRENYNLGISQSNHFVSISGSQDNGTSVKNENGWIEMYGADGMEGIVHPLNSKWMIGSLQYGGRRRTINGGLTETGVSQPQSGNGNAYWIAPMVYDPNNHMTVYSYAKNVFKSIDFGSSWTMLGTSATFPGLPIEFASIAENNTNIMAITYEEKINLSTDGGLTFTDIKNNLPNNWITDVVFDPNDDSTIIVTYDTYQNNGQKIFMSQNLGSSWQNITYNLGAMPIKSVIIDHSDSSYIYIGATIGVYVKSMNASSWELYNPNLPNVTISEMEINYGSNTIKAATWGRGLWEYTLKDRAGFPAILKTSISSEVTENSPKSSVDQYVSSEVDYYGNKLTAVFVRWAVNTPNFNPANAISMSNTGGNTWTSVSPLPDYPAGTKLYFKVYAVGESNDTSETYKFMYELKPFVYCAASGTTDFNNMHINRFRLSNVDQLSGNNGSSYYANTPIILYTDSTYTAIGDFNLGFSGESDFNVWIDYNRDSEFGGNEFVVNNPNFIFSGPASSSGTFTVPSNASEDTTLLRARYGYWNNGDSPCGSTLGEVEEYPVIIRRAPAISYNSNGIFCQQIPLELTYTGSSADSVSWLFTGAGNASFTGNSINANLNAGVYSLQITAYKYGQAFSEFYPNQILINPNPSLQTSSDTSLCLGESIALSATSNGSINWSNGITNNQTFTPNATQSYVATATLNGCSVSEMVLVTVYPLPFEPVINYTAGILQTGTAAAYQWYFNGVSIPGAEEATYTPVQNGIYSVEITDSNGCVNSSNSYTLSGLNTIDYSPSELLIFPNPGSGIYQILLPNTNHGIETLEVVNYLGQTIKRYPIESNETQFMVDISEHAAGVYYLKTNLKDGLYAKILKY